MPGSILVPGFSSSTKLPGFAFAVILGGPGTGTGAAPNRLLLWGNMIGVALTGASPSFSVAAGTASLNTVYQLFAASDAATLFGAGSELHREAERVFEQYPTCTVFAMATAQGSTASTGVVTVTGAPTAALTARVVVAGKGVDAAIASGDSVTTTATAIATAVNSQSDWPVTAQNAAGVVTLTSKHTGARSAQITVRVQLIYGTQVVTATGGSLAATLQGSTLTLSGGTATGTVYRLTGGTTEESLTTPLATVASTRYHRHAVPYTGTTALDALLTQVNTMADVNHQLRQQAVAASQDTYANAIAVSGGRNQPRLQLAWHYNSDLPTGELAAQLAAARLGGDASVTAINPRAGEDTDPATNLDGLMLATVPAQYSVADQPTRAQMEAALNNGLTPLAARSDGGVYVPRSITTYFKDTNSNPTYDVIDTEFVAVSDYVADDLQGSMAVDFAGCKLGDPDPTGAPLKQPKVVTADDIKAYLAKKLRDYERAALLSNLDAKIGQLAVVKDPAAAGRVLADIPCPVIPALHQCAANVRQLAA